MALPNTDPNQVTPPVSPQEPGQVQPDNSQDRPLTVKEAQPLIEEAIAKGAELGFRRAQGHTDAVVKKVREEVSTLEKRLGRPLTDEEKGRVQGQVQEEVTATPPANSGQGPGQVQPGEPATPTDPVNAEAMKIMETNGAVIDMEADPEAKLIVFDKGVYAYHKSIDEASKAKAERLKNNPVQPQRTPTSMGADGGQVDETFANKSLDETWEASGI